MFQLTTWGRGVFNKSLFKTENEAGMAGLLLRAMGFKTSISFISHLSKKQRGEA